MSAPAPAESPLNRVPVAILGAGLTGLSAALALAEARVSYRLFEREPRAGGHAVTREERGFRFDRTGHLLHVRDPALRELVESLLAGRFRRLSRRSAVFSHGVFTRYPFQANTFGLPPEVAYECLSGFLAARAAPPAEPPRNFEDYCLAYFGDGISRHFMLPYNARLWGVSPRDITSEWCERFVPRPTLEEVLRGALGASPPELGYNTQFIYPNAGIGELSNALADRARPELNRAPARIDLRARRLIFADEQVGFDSLISSVPLPALLALIEELPEAVQAAGAKLRSSRLHYLDIALRRANPRPFHWVYVPEAQYPFYRVGCYSHFSAELAPPGHASLYVELVSRAPPDLARLVPQVIRGLTELGMITGAEDVAFVSPQTLEPAYVIYDHAYRCALDVIEPFLREQRIFSAGRYGGWNYSSMEDALRFGRSAAAAAMRARATDG